MAVVDAVDTAAVVATVIDPEDNPAADNGRIEESLPVIFHPLTPRLLAALGRDYQLVQVLTQTAL